MTSIIALYKKLVNKNRDSFDNINKRRKSEKEKGGTLVQDETGKLRLLEIAQVPDEKKEAFMDLEQFPYFNSNNIWISLKKMLALLESNALYTDMIVNPKTINGQDVIQLESAMGSAISSFDNPGIVIIPRHRFMPVKKSSDFLLMQSDLFILEQDSVRKNKAHHRDLPLITLKGPLENVN